MTYDSDYEVRLAELGALGGDTSKQYDSVYEIDLAILDIIQGGGGGHNYAAGENIDISEDYVISATGYSKKEGGFAELPKKEEETWLTEPRKLTDEEKAEFGDYEWYNAGDDSDYEWSNGRLYELTYNSDIDDYVHEYLCKITDAEYISNDDLNIYGMIFNTDVPVDLDYENHNYAVSSYVTNNSASAEFSHAEGSGTTALGYAAHSEGANNTASGYSAHAGGNGCLSEGNSSFVHGDNNIAQSTATAGVAFGTNNTVNNPNEFVTGAHNKNWVGSSLSNTQIFSIGNGTNATNKKNVISVMKNGDIYVYGIGFFNGSNYPFEGWGVTTLQDSINHPRRLLNKVFYTDSVQGSLNIDAGNGTVIVDVADAPTIYFMGMTNLDDEVRVDILVRNTGDSPFTANLSGAYQLMNNSNNAINPDDYVLYDCRWFPYIQTWLVIPIYKHSI
jgi:hypothetical protein